MRKRLLILCVSLLLMGSIKAQVSDSLRWAITSQKISKDIATFKLLRDSTASVLGKDHFFYGEIHKMCINSKLILDQLGLEVQDVPPDTTHLVSSENKIRRAITRIMDTWHCYGVAPDCHSFIDDFVRNRYIQKQENKIIIQIFIVNIETSLSYIKEYM